MPVDATRGRGIAPAAIIVAVLIVLVLAGAVWLRLHARLELAAPHPRIPTPPMAPNAPPLPAPPRLPIPVPTPR